MAPKDGGWPDEDDGEVRCATDEPWTCDGGAEVIYHEEARPCVVSDDEGQCCYGCPICGRHICDAPNGDVFVYPRKMIH